MASSGATSCHTLGKNNVTSCLCMTISRGEEYVTLSVFVLLQ